MQKNNSGITLIPLVITVVILLILTTVSVDTGIDYINNVRISKIVVNMKLVEAKVYDIYEEYQFNEKELIGNIADISNLEILNEEKEEIISTYNINSFEELIWYEWNQDILKEQGLDENMIDENSCFYINYKYGEILCSMGTKYDGKKYYSKTYFSKIL